MSRFYVTLGKLFLSLPGVKKSPRLMAWGMKLTARGTASVAKQKASKFLERAKDSFKPED